MTRIALLLISLFTAITFNFSQTKVFGRPLVSKMDHEIAPYVSANGRAMVFMQKDFRNPHFVFVYSEKKDGEWTRPVEIPVVNKHGKLLLEGSYCLSEDGKTLYFSTKKHPSIGDYDIWITHLRNGNWSVPENLGKPINSKFGDAFPSISADGRTLYFSRSLAHSHGHDAGCSQLMMSKKKGSMWSEPVPIKELNTGCEMAPRILADNETLIFASKRNGRKVFDLYRSQQLDGKWATPTKFETLSNEEDNKLCSFSADGKYVYHAVQSEETLDLARSIVLERERSKTVRMYRFRVFDESLNGRLVIRDVINKKTISKIRLNKGYKTVYLPEGGWYDLSYFAKDKVYYSEYVDATNDFRYGMENRSIKLTDVRTSTDYSLALVFNEDSTSLDKTKSQFELKRAARLIREYGANATVLYYSEEKPVIMDTIITVDSLGDSSVVIKPHLIEPTNKLSPEQEFLFNIYAELKKYLKEPEKLLQKVESLPSGANRIGDVWIRFD